MVEVGGVGAEARDDGVVQDGRRVVQRRRPAGRRNGSVVQLAVHLGRAVDGGGKVAGVCAVLDDRGHGGWVVGGEGAGASLEWTEWEG